MFNQGEKAYLLLENGRIFEGRSFGAKGTAFGEVVFSTCMTGYQEVLTDPACFGQLVIQTFPLIGCCGVNDEDNESDKVHASGYIVREWCSQPSNFRMNGNINDYLSKNNVVGICNIDTRCLTRLIRDAGVMNGVITTEDIRENKDDLIEKVKSYKINNAILNVSCKVPKTYAADNLKYKVALIDYGVKKSIIDELLCRGCDVTVLPAETSAGMIKQENFDGIVLSGGPGNPSENQGIIDNLKEISELGLPMFGIGMGHQLLALAYGAKSRKMKHGHRGNYPFAEVLSGGTFIASKNNGYEIFEFPDESVMKKSFINANDGSCEGMVYKKINAMTVQFHPEAGDAAFLFDTFINKMKVGEK